MIVLPTIAILLTALAPASSVPVGDWLSVDVRVEEGKAASPDRLPSSLLVEMLSTRLGPVGIWVGAGGEVPPVGRDREWRLAIDASDALLRVTLFDPEQAVAIERTLSSDRRRPSELAHTVTLWVVEGMAPVLERLMRLLPPGRAPEPEPAPIETPVVAPRDVSPTGLRSSPVELHVGLAAHGAMSWPREATLAAGGLLLGVHRGRLASELEIALNTPLVAKGVDYRVSAQYGTVRLGVGFGHWLGSLRLVVLGTGGARLAREQRGGASIVAGEHWYLSPSVGLSTRLGWTLTTHWTAYAAVSAERFTSYQRFTVDGVPVLNIGRDRVDAALALLRRF